MTTKKPTSKRKTTPRIIKHASVLDKYGSSLKLFANYGFAGLAFGYLLIVTIPDAQKTFNATLEKQAEQQREDRKAAYDHGEKAVDKIAGSIDGLKNGFTENTSALRETFGSVQSVTQGNQRALIDEQKRTNELLENQVKRANPKIEMTVPEWVPVKPKAAQNK